MWPVAVGARHLMLNRRASDPNRLRFPSRLTGSHPRGLKPEHEFLDMPQERLPVPTEADGCQVVHPEVMGASSRPPRLKRVLWHLRYRGVIWAVREAMARTQLFPRRYEEESATISRSDSSGSKPLRLTEGEWVEVRSEAEIRKILDSAGRTAGLTFMPEMWRLCGQRFRVYKKLTRFISDTTGELRSIRDTVLLEGVVCDGSAHLGCQRSCFFWWREAWLKRVEP